ncbi:class I SAM-dependent DNA methyltransferase [Roseateles sp.]|uniref:class I SAM-dependent DNA methyltransferase n=1 Tax=Roseateles sp. TaxID=1971397 RepID=UPI003D1273CE
MSEDHNAESVACFDKHAQRYAENYFDLRNYDRFYQALLERLPSGPVRLLDLACGAGNVAAFVRQARTDAQILCVDQSAAMLAAAQQRLPGIATEQADCRDLSAISAGFDAAAFCFGLSYFNDEDARQVLAELARLLRVDGSLLLSTISGDPVDSGPQLSSSGDRVHMFYRQPETIAAWLNEAGFSVLRLDRIASPANASQKTVDVVILARRNSVPAD